MIALIGLLLFHHEFRNVITLGCVYFMLNIDVMWEGKNADRHGVTFIVEMLVRQLSSRGNAGILRAQNKSHQEHCDRRQQKREVSAGWPLYAATIPLDQKHLNHSAESKLNFLHSHTLHISNSTLSLQGQRGHVAQASNHWLHSTFIWPELIGWLQWLTKC